MISEEPGKKSNLIMKGVAKQVYRLFVLLLAVSLFGCAANPPVQDRYIASPTFNERLEKVFSPPWWYHGPVKLLYDKMYPPPWYQGSLEWMRDEVKGVCDAKTEAMVRAASSAAIGTLAAPAPVSVVFGIVRVVGTGGVVTYCRLNE